jgi:hypothetical protein
MATTLTDIRNAAEANHVSVFIDSATPVGYFGVTAKVLGFVATYLLEGELGDENAEVKGHIVIIDREHDTETLGYAKGGLVGGYYLGRVESYEDTFQKILKHVAAPAMHA